MKFLTKRASALAAIALSGTLVLTACGGTTTVVTRANPSAATLSITMLPKNLGNAYFDTSTAGGETAAEEVGASIEEVGPQERPRTRRCSTSTPRPSRA